MSSDLQQLFDKHHNADLLYREVCTLKLQLATVQQNGADTGSPTPQLPDFLETAFGSTQLGNPVSGDVCVTRLLAVVQAPQVPDGSADESSCLLSKEQRIQLDTVKSLLKVIKHQQPEKWPDVVSRIIKENLPLEILWQLHDDDILSLQTFLDSSLRDEGRCHRLTQQLTVLCGEYSSNADIRRQIVTAFCSHLVITGFPAKKAEDNTLKRIAVGILDGVTRGLLDKHISKETLLLPTDILHSETEVPPICFKKFCTHTVSVITSHRPNMKVSEALKRQTEWKSGKIPHSLKAFFKQLLLPFETGEVLEMLRRILEKQEVNWQMVLSCLATFLVCFQQASASIQEHVRRLLAESLESGDMENTIVGFLMARQSCTEGGHIFPTYQQWFQDVFGDGARSPAGKKKSFTFLMKFLTDLVPFEPAEVLKVHILKPPFVPAKCRDLLTDYVILAKTRLADLKVPLEEPSTAIYSDQGRTHSESDPGVQDVEKALAVFESTGKLPTTVMEASIFRKPYFVGRFLPALLQPRHLPDVPDTRMRFIDSLKRAGKIPSSLYTKYEEACRRETKQLLEGVFEVGEEDDVDDMLLEPMEQLSHRLRQLTETVCSQSPQNRVSELISVISEKVENIVPTPAEGSPSNRDLCVLDLCQPSMNPLHVQVVDELLNCVCRTLHASRSVGHQMWLQQLVQMLSQHTAIHMTFFTRLLQLIVSKDCVLADHHIDGLAAVTLQISMDQQEQQFPSLSIKGHDGDSNVPDGTFLLLLLHCLANRNAGEMRHSLRFLSATLKLLFLHHDDCISAKAQDFIPRHFFVTFCLLVWRLFPELRPAQGLSHFDLKHKLDVPSAEDDTDMMDFVDNVAKALYISEKFQGFVKTQKPSFEEWIDFELRVDPSHDCLSPLQRSEYLLTLISWYCVPGGGGGSTHEGSQLRHCCSLLMKRIAVAMSRAQSPLRKCPRCGQSPVSLVGGTGSNQYSADILLTTLAKLVQNLSVDTQSSPDSVPWLLQQVSQLISASQSGKDIVPEAVLRVVFSLPAYLLFTDTLGGSLTVSQNQVRSAVLFIDEVVIPHGHDGCILCFDITLHLLQGFFTAGDHSENQSKSDLSAVERHPVLLLSALVHWPRLCVILPAHWIGKYPWDSFSSLLTAVDCFITDDGVCFPSVGQEKPFCLAAAVFSCLSQRRWKVEDKLLKRLVQCLHQSVPQAVVVLSEILLASLSSQELCHQELSQQMDVEMKLLTEMWLQWPELMQTAGQPRGAEFSMHAGFADRRPFMDLAVLRCLSLLPTDVVAAEGGVLEAAMRTYARLCQRFEDTAASGQVADVEIMLHLSKSLHQLVRVAPLAVVRTLDPENIKRCGLEIFRLQQQRMNSM